MLETAAGALGTSGAMNSSILTRIADQGDPPRGCDALIAHSPAARQTSPWSPATRCAENSEAPRTVASPRRPCAPWRATRAGEPDRETLRGRAAHAGPIDEDTLAYRIELHAVSPED